MNETINGLFEKQVINTRDNIAIIEDEKEISYKELNEKVNQLTWFLKEKGINKNDRICLVMEHSIDMIYNNISNCKKWSNLYTNRTYFSNQKNRLYH